MCRPADLPLILNIHTWFIIYIIFIDAGLCLTPDLKCLYADLLTLNIHTGLIRYISYVIGHAGLLSSRVIVKARYGVCILFWGSGGLPPRHRIMTSLLPKVGNY